MLLHHSNISFAQGAIEQIKFYFCKIVDISGTEAKRRKELRNNIQIQWNVVNIISIC